MMDPGHWWRWISSLSLNGLFWSRWGAIVTLPGDLSPPGVPMKCWPEGTSFALHLLLLLPTNHDPTAALHFILSCTSVKYPAMHSASNAVHYSWTASKMQKRQLPASNYSAQFYLCTAIPPMHCLCHSFHCVSPNYPPAALLTAPRSRSRTFLGPLRFSLRLADMPTMQSLGMAGNQEEDLCEALWLDLISLLGNPVQSTSPVDLIFKAWRASQGKWMILYNWAWRAISTRSPGLMVNDMKSIKDCVWYQIK